MGLFLFRQHGGLLFSILELKIAILSLLVLLFPRNTYSSGSFDHSSAASLSDLIDRKVENRKYVLLDLQTLVARHPLEGEERAEVEAHAREHILCLP